VEMQRKVPRLGGHAGENSVSQTPELAQMGNVVIARLIAERLAPAWARLFGRVEGLAVIDPK
jgi:hypothetical protein